MEIKIKTRRIPNPSHPTRPSFTTQIGYHNGQGWVGLTNLRRSRGGYVSGYPGWFRTIGEWKKRTAEILTISQEIVDNLIIKHGIR